jgi:hypothetical protein
MFIEELATQKLRKVLAFYFALDHGECVIETFRIDSSGFGTYSGNDRLTNFSRKRDLGGSFRCYVSVSVR